MQTQTKPDTEETPRPIMRRSPRFAAKARTLAARPSLSFSKPLWHKLANCAGRDQAVFYGASDRLPMTRRQADAARAVCQACPVRRDCLAEAIATAEELGVWGAFTGAERLRAIALFDQAEPGQPPVEHVPDGQRALTAVLAVYDAGILPALVVRL